MARAWRLLAAIVASFHLVVCHSAGARLARPCRPCPTACAVARGSVRADAVSAAGAVNGGAHRGPDPAMLLQWAEARGASVAGVSITERAPGGAGWGLQAAAACSEGDVLASVPQDLELRSDDGAVQAALDSVGVPAAASVRWPLRLGLRLVQELLVGESSPWADYLQSLPGAFNALPLMYRNSDLRALKCDYLAARVLAAREAIDQLAAAIAEAGDTSAAEAGLTGATAADLRWAYAAAQSRALPVSPGGRAGRVPPGGFGGQAGGGGDRGGAGVIRCDGSSIVPVLDLCNHSPDPSCELRRGGGGGGVELVARRALGPGASLTVDYGVIGAAEFLLRFGLVEDVEAGVAPEEADVSASTGAGTGASAEAGGRARDFVIATFDAECLSAAHSLGLPKPMAPPGLRLGGMPDSLLVTPSPPAVDTEEELQPFQADALRGLGLLPESGGVAAADADAADAYMDSGMVSGPFVTFGPDRIDGRLLAALRVLYAQTEEDLEGKTLEELQAPGRLLEDTIEEQVRQTAVGWAMLTSGACASGALTAGYGGGVGRTDAHMLVAGRATTAGARSSNERLAHSFRKAQMRTAVASLRHAKTTLLHAMPLESILDDVEPFADMGDYGDPGAPEDLDGIGGDYHSFSPGFGDGLEGDFEASVGSSKGSKADS